MEYSRIIELDDAELLALVVKKYAMVEEGKVMVAEMEELAKKHKALKAILDEKNPEITDVKKQILARLELIASDKLDKYEFPIQTELVDGKVIFKVENALENFNAEIERINKWKEISPVNVNVG